MSTPDRAEHSGGGIGHRIVHGMIVIIFFGLFMRLGAFLVNWLINHVYGTGPVLDGFTAVYNKIIYLLVFSSALKIMNPVFMPLFAERRQQEGEKKAWELASTVTNLSFVLGAIAAAAGFILAPEIVGTLLPKFKPETQQFAVTLLRWMLPGVLAQMLAIQALGVFNSYKVFSYPSAADAAQKLVWMAGIVVGLYVLRVPHAAKSAEALAMAPHLIGATYLVSCLAQATVLLVGLRDRLALYRLGFPAVSRTRLAEEALWLGAAAGIFALWIVNLDAAWMWRVRLTEENRDLLAICGALGAGCFYAASLWFRARGQTGIMGRFALLAAPLIVGVLFARFREQGLSFYQTFTHAGEYGMIELARKVANFPSVLIAFSLSVAMFPYLCDMAVRRDDEQYARILTSSLRMIALLLVPLTAVTLVMAGPVMQLIFDKGKWSPQDIHLHGLALAILSTGLFFFAIENVLMQAFFSQQRTVLPTALGILFSVLPVAAMWVLMDRLGLVAWAFLFVCIAEPSARAMKNLCLLYFVHRRHPLMSGAQAASFLARLAAISGGMMLAAWGTYLAVARVLPIERFQGKGFVRFKVGIGLHVAAPAVAALAVFLALCVLLRMEETQILMRWVRERGWKRRGVKLPGAGAPEA